MENSRDYQTIRCYGTRTLSMEDIVKTLPGCTITRVSSVNTDDGTGLQLDLRREDGKNITFTMHPHTLRPYRGEHHTTEEVN